MLNRHPCWGQIMNDETLINLSQAAAIVAEMLPTGALNCSTLSRWVSRGVRGRRLEVRRIGGRVYTTRAALGRFLDALNQPAGV